MKLGSSRFKTDRRRFCAFSVSTSNLILWNLLLQGEMGMSLDGFKKELDNFMEEKSVVGP